MSIFCIFFFSYSCTLLFKTFLSHTKRNKIDNIDITQASKFLMKLRNIIIQFFLRTSSDWWMNICKNNSHYHKYSINITIAMYVRFYPNVYRTITSCTQVKVSSTSSEEASFIIIGISKFDSLVGRPLVYIFHSKRNTAVM